jgi:hypothetical protein
MGENNGESNLRQARCTQPMVKVQHTTQHNGGLVPSKLPHGSRSAVADFGHGGWCACVGACARRVTWAPTLRLARNGSSEVDRSRSISRITHQDIPSPSKSLFYPSPPCYIIQNARGPWPGPPIWVLPDTMTQKEKHTLKAGACPRSTWPSTAHIDESTDPSLMG